MPDEPIDLQHPRYALEGKVVTMDAARTVLTRGVVYVDGERIAAVLPTSAPAPPGFEAAPMVHTGGTIYPGLIELHNHLSYNILPLWEVPRRFSNNAQWKRHADYRKKVSGPMQVLGKTPGYVEAIVRYVECKCLLGGVTTSQGVTLNSNAGIRRHYRGLVRNVEDPVVPGLPGADTRVADVEATRAEWFLERLRGSSCLLLHLSEGVDDWARAHFLALHLPDGTWAITPALAGIHSAALQPGDFAVLQQHGGSMVWSPLSNYLLYGGTADVRAAKEAGVRIALGSDWSPSGSKNLLGELKVAHVVSEAQGGLFTGAELLAMATTNAAAILKWDHALGSLEAGKLADLLVVNGRRGDPYDRLLASRESSITLVVIGGIPRCGQARLMDRFDGEWEDVQVGRTERQINLAQEEADPIVAGLTLREATARLQQGLQDLATLVVPLERAAFGEILPLEEPEAPIWYLELEQTGLADAAIRPHLPFGPDGAPTGAPEPDRDPFLDVLLAGPPLSEILEPVALDALTVVDDSGFLRRLAAAANLPDVVRRELPRRY